MLPILLVKLMMKIRYIYYMAELVRDKKEKSDWFAQESDFFNTDRLWINFGELLLRFIAQNN